MKRFFPLLLLIIMLAGCKPTEKGYQAAYDAAKAKREQVRQENMLPAHGLQSDEGPQRRIVEGDTIYIDREVVRTADGTRAPKSWYLVVGVYKMDTNAKASVGDIQAKGWSGATVLKGRQGRWFAAAAGANSMDSLCMESKRFRADFPAYPYVGLPGSPVLMRAN